MALQKCHECGNDVSSEAKSCPKCGAAVKSKSSAFKAVVAVLIFACFGAYFYGGGIERDTSRQMDNMEITLAHNEAMQYQIAKRNGSQTDACVHASMASAAFLQAKDEASFKQWKDIEKSECGIVEVKQ